MATRKSMSKKTRFEIFKRDGFTCQYCGAQPPDAVLVVDHINPVANGGDNDHLNLITSCEVCNQGKGARLLERAAPMPDADIEWLETQQEIAELRRYQSAKIARDQLLAEITKSFQEMWWGMVDPCDAPADSVILKWLSFSSPGDLEKAIGATAVSAYKLRSFTDKLKYCSACLRNIVAGE
jgi:hypothetical protein